MQWSNAENCFLILAASFTRWGMQERLRISWAPPKTLPVSERRNSAFAPGSLYPSICRVKWNKRFCFIKWWNDGFVGLCVCVLTFPPAFYGNFPIDFNRSWSWHFVCMLFTYIHIHKLLNLKNREKMFWRAVNTNTSSPPGLMEYFTKPLPNNQSSIANSSNIQFKSCKYSYCMKLTRKSISKVIFLNGLLAVLNLQHP